METLTTSQFVERLPVLDSFYEVLAVKNYVSVPDDWFIAVTDVVQSRAAIDAGRFKAVNMAGVAMITGIMNQIGHHKLPYIFGGDGAAVAFAPKDYDAVYSVLSKTRTWVSEELSLELRAAIVPVKKNIEQNCEVRLAGLFVSQAITNYAFTGHGLALAEKLLKKGEYEIEPASTGEYPDLTGLSCRWMPVEKESHKIISMIVEAADGKDRIPEHILVELLEMVNADKAEGHPVPEEQIRFKWPVDGLNLEASATGDSMFKLYCIALIAWILDRTGWSMGEFNPHHYRRQLGLNTDYRKVHDGIRMTLSLN